MSNTPDRSSPSSGVAGAGSKDGSPPDASSSTPPVTPSALPPVVLVTAVALEHASREILKATLVPLQIVAPMAGQAAQNHAYAKQLALQPGEVAAVRRLYKDPSGQSVMPGDRSTVEQGEVPVPWELLSAFASAPVASLYPSIPEFVHVSSAGLRAFGAALQQLRTDAVVNPSSNFSTPLGSSTPQTPSAPPAAGRVLLNRVVVANKGYDLNVGAAGAAGSRAVAASPVGMLNLERLEMVPAGIERGELVATVPLAPGEETSVTQKEWSVTSKEFTSIVTDSLENVSETGVTDNTELAQSTTSQLTHANQFNITGTVSGGIPIISGSASSAFAAQDSGSQSATDSRKHAMSMTQKASSRTKQEHKVTISTTTVSGTAETTTRTLRNPTADPIRIDYFSMLRKWRVRLYRYGLRMTYDLVIPEPAGAMRAAYAELSDIQAQLGPFAFGVGHSEITTDVWPGETQPHYLVLADRYEAQVPIPPGPAPIITVPAPTDGLWDDDEKWHFYQTNFHIPDGFQVDHIRLVAMMNTNNKGNSQSPKGHSFIVVGSDFIRKQDPTLDYNLTLTSGSGNFMAGYTGAQTLVHFLQWESIATVTFTVFTSPTTASVEQWQASVWSALYNAAQTQYYAAQQDYAARAEALQGQLNNVDTLTLRREESDEVMKGVLRWLTSDYDLMPADVVTAFVDSGTDLTHGVGFTGRGDRSVSGGVPDTGQGLLGISAADWAAVAAHEDHVRFVNQAIEWENVVTFLYSYFWDIPESWDFIRRIRHPDATRQAFLRAGSGRVVLTIRKGWEVAWVNFLATGDPDTESPGHPYLPIAREIAAYDDRNYPGIPPANPSKTATMAIDATIAACSALIAPDPAGRPVSVALDTSDGFIVGARIVIDGVGSTNIQEDQRITAIPDSTHIMVSALTYAHDGTSTPFSVVQPGEKGALIAEWNEYTPTSGTDIAMTSNLTTVV